MRTPRLPARRTTLPSRSASLGRRSPPSAEESVTSHAEAIDRIGDAATERHGIERLMADSSSDSELRAHIATCEACQQEVRAWQTTAAALRLAAPVTSAQSSELEAGGASFGVATAVGVTSA